MLMITSTFCFNVRNVFCLLLHDAMLTLFILEQYRKNDLVSECSAAIEEDSIRSFYTLYPEDSM